VFRYPSLKVYAGSLGGAAYLLSRLHVKRVHAGVRLRVAATEPVRPHGFCDTDTTSASSIDTEIRARPASNKVREGL